jgi:Big-like domain-containing protein
MSNRLFCTLFLLACSITLPASAAAQVFVQSHTNIETDAAGNRTLVALCRTQMLDATTIANYPAAESVCMLNENGNLIQTVSCSARSDAFCATPTIAREPVVAGVNYQTASRHILFFTRLKNFCTVNGVLVDCDQDPLTYGLSVFAAIPPSRLITDSGQIFPAGGLTFWIGGNVNGGDDFLIGLSTETQFQSAQVIPFGEVHTRANEVTAFHVNGSQNIADWTLIGTAGTLAAPLRGNSVTFTAPTTVPVQQVDTLKACKVDTSHGTDCDSAQIIVEVVKVDIPAGNPNDIPRPDNSTELLGGQTARYNATVIQGARTLVDAPVKWTFNDPSGLNLITVSPGGVNSSGFVTVAPQSVFQNNVFLVNITATAVDQNGNAIDPAVAVSAPFNIRISPATVTMTTVPSPGLNDKTNPDVYQATGDRTFNFAANVDGPQNPNNRVITTWDQDFIPTTMDFAPPGRVLQFPDNPSIMEYQITVPPPKGIISTTIKACVGGHIDSSILGSITLVGAQCAFFPMVFAPPPFPTSLPQTINSGESTLVTITGTGFGAAPTLSFSDPTVSFTPVSVSGPDAKGVTTVTGTMTAAPVPPPIPFTNKIIPVTITSSLPPPSTPVAQNVFVRPVTTTFAVTPVNPTLLVSQSQQFTTSLGCQTFGGNTCTVPQTSTCSMFSGPGTMTASCLYTAPASLATQTQARAKVCFTFGNVCTTFSINLVPVTIAVSPASASPGPGQSQQFQATVTNVPNNNQSVTWSINPAAGTITAAGLYTAPAVISAAQTVTVNACSTVDPTQCGSATVSLVPPDFQFSVAQSTGLSAPGFQNGFNLTVTPIGVFTGNVTLSATLPAGIGMSAQFSPAAITGSGSSVATFPVLTSTPAGTYPVTITATSGSLVHSVQITVTVVLPTLSLTVTPPQTASAGQTVIYKAAVSWTNFFGSVSVNVTGIPPGSTWSQVGGTFFAPDTATLTLTTPTTLAPGTYNLTFTATGSGLVTVGSSSLSVGLTKTQSTALTIPEPPPPPPPPPDGCTTRFCLDQ